MTYQDGLAALGDPTRRAIFELLAEGPTPVGELAARLPVSRPAVSQHLKVLKGVGLVRDRAAGTRRVYQLDPDGVAAMRSYLDRFWDRALADFKAAVESPEHPGKTDNTDNADNAGDAGDADNEEQA
jgi:DNA-binding transcriptional ArsR family regulator